MKNKLSIHILLVSGLIATALAEDAPVRLHGNLSPLVPKAKALRRAPADEQIRFSISLPIRNQAEFDSLLNNLYNPDHPAFHQFLKTGEFAQRFGPSQEDYDAVAAFVRSQGLEIVAKHSNRLLLVASGSAEKVEGAFKVRMMHYQGKDGRIFHGPDNEPAIPSALSETIRQPAVNGRCGSRSGYPWRSSVCGRMVDADEAAMDA